MSQEAVVGIVEHENSILIGLKQKRDGHAMSQEWHIPGGKVSHGESPEEALAREIHEEAGINISKIELLEQIDVPADGFQVLWFICTAENSEVQAGDDLKDAKFVKREEVHKYCGENAIARWPAKVRKYFHM